MKGRFLPIYLRLLLACAVTPALAQGIDLSVDNIRNGTGNIIVVVFDEKHAFENLRIGSAIVVAELPAKATRLAHTFAELDAGPYAVFLFHDENSDQDLNFNGKHLLEGVGATGAFLPESEPNFLQASVYPGPVNIHIFYDE